MKIAIINFSGNTGKTTMAAQVFAPRMPSAKYFSIESLNVGADSDGLDVEKVKGKRYGELVDQLMMIDDAIIDVGASNVEDFLKMMQQSAGSHEEFDRFIVPVIKEKKQMADINTIRALRAIGVPKKKIHVVFNKVELDDNVESEFEAIFALNELEKSFVLNPKAIVYANEVFERLKAMGLNLGTLRDDTTDYRANLRTETDPDKKAHCVQMVGIQRLAVTANENLDTVFGELTR
jgi:hypothetical protein